MMRRARNVAFALTVLAMAVFSAFQSVLFWPFVFLGPRVFEPLSALVSLSFFSMTGFVWQLLHATPVRIFHDPVESSGPSDPPKREPDALVVAMNHRTRLDWMFLWMVLPRIIADVYPSLRHGAFFSWPFDVLHRLRIVMKSEIGSIPYMGWATDQASFIFLKRNRDLDEAHIKRSIKEMIAVGIKPVLLIFPEGTDLSAKNLGKSHEYSKDKGLAQRDYTLYPRLKGMQAVVAALTEAFEGSDSTVEVVDVTIGYSGTVVQSEVQLIQGRACDTVDLWLQRRRLSTERSEFSVECSRSGRPSSCIDPTPEGVAEWLEQSFLWREATLASWSSPSGTIPATAPPSSTPEGALYREWFLQQRERVALEVPVPSLNPMWSTLACLVLFLAECAVCWYFPWFWGAVVVTYHVASPIIARNGGWVAIKDALWGRPPRDVVTPSK
jgi:1-acyl-sn-glycerol-3-phosphate acyltransferase